ncbi:MAG: hypothetical protein ACEY3D_01520 [Rickettsia sp.]
MDPVVKPRDDIMFFRVIPATLK